MACAVCFRKVTKFSKNSPQWTRGDRLRRSLRQKFPTSDFSLSPRFISCFILFPLPPAPNNSPASAPPIPALSTKSNNATKQTASSDRRAHFPISFSLTTTSTYTIHLHYLPSSSFRRWRVYSSNVQLDSSLCTQAIDRASHACYRAYLVRTPKAYTPSGQSDRHIPLELSSSGKRWILTPHRHVSLTHACFMLHHVKGCNYWIYNFPTTAFVFGGHSYSQHLPKHTSRGVYKCKPIFVDIIVLLFILNHKPKNGEMYHLNTKYVSKRIFHTFNLVSSARLLKRRTPIQLYFVSLILSS